MVTIFVLWVLTAPKVEVALSEKGYFCTNDTCYCCNVDYKNLAGITRLSAAAKYDIYFKFAYSRSNFPANQIYR